MRKNNNPYLSVETRKEENENKKKTYQSKKRILKDNK